MSCSRLLVMFVLLNFLSNTQALKQVDEMNWKEDPKFVWGTHPLVYWVPIVQRNVILLLNVPNYTNGTEKTYIATGVLLDNSRILTSYNPFKELVTDPKFAENIMVLFTTGGVPSTNATHRYSVVKISTSIVCAREIAYSSPDEMHVWHDKRHSPLHDLMILRMEDKIGIAYSSKFNFLPSFPRADYYWSGPLVKNSSLISYIARPEDKINTPLWLNFLVFQDEDKPETYNRLKTFEYGDDDAPLVDCDEWLPRQWGYFICIRNIDNFSALPSGATLFARKTLFGIGSFAMFKNDTGILVFTDVRPYEQLIRQTCGDEEFL